jgi:hypothetical protein
MSLRRIPPPLVSLISTLEVPGGTITTAFLLMKLPTNIEIFGSLVMMTGIAGFYLVEGIANRSIQPKKEHPMRECS